jgi:hypothetical protein
MARMVSLWLLLLLIALLQGGVPFAYLRRPHASLYIESYVEGA